MRLSVSRKMESVPICPDNSYEIVRFTAAWTGTYRIKVSYRRFDGNNETVGIAYHIQ